MITIFLPTAPDLFFSEINRGIPLRFLKEHAKHTHIERFSETPRTCVERNNGTLIQDLLEHHGFVHIVVIRAGFPIIRFADRKRLSQGMGECRCCVFAVSIVLWLERMIGNEPAAPHFIGSGDTP